MEINITSELPIELENDTISETSEQINMNEIVGKADIIFLCLDTLRYDVAFRNKKMAIPSFK